ncbi:MAG: DNA cytosine methyltransferase [Dehalococcoidia bacterium]
MTRGRSTVVDIFACCGGITCGFQWAGFRPLGGADIQELYLRTYARNFPDAKPIHADLAELPPAQFREMLGLERGELDCLVGGPPCQGFSKNVPAINRFLDDPRNQLIGRYLDYVEELRPKILLLENVAEIVRAYDGAVTREIITALNSWGYEVDVKVLVAADFGVPQIRRRAFFFANRLGAPVLFPTHTHAQEEAPSDLFGNGRLSHVTVWNAIGDLPSLEAGEGKSPVTYTMPPQSDYQRLVREGSDLLHDHVSRPLRDRQLERVRALREGEGVQQLPPMLRPKSGYSGAYARLHSQGVARTITRWVFHSGSGRFSHPFDDRVITIREAARLQGFPDWFVFTGTYVQKAAQVGEGVPPLIAKAFAEIAQQLLLERGRAHDLGRNFVLDGASNGRVLGAEKSHDRLDELVRVDAGGAD